MYVNPLTAVDFYKTDHRRQYPAGTTEIYSNFTPRANRASNVLPELFDNKVVFFGLQYFIKDFLINCWQQEFFSKDKAKVVRAYKRRMDLALGENTVETSHIEALHDLGYLPLRIKALDEGVRVPIGVPVLTIVNTHPEFFWLTNYVETVISCYLWKIMTSATTAFEYKKLLHKYAMKTGIDPNFVLFQSHDFSFRSMSSLQDGAASGAAHLTSFWGTDTISAIDLLEEFYDVRAEDMMIGCSVPATEHSVMCMGLKEGEQETFKRLLTELYPKGIVSIVSDSWDLWKVVAEYMAELKGIIIKRDGKLVLRPDSGDPVKIITGNPDAASSSPENKGVLECLWEIFGGTTTKTGHRILDSHIGVIFGDGINISRANNVLEAMDKKGFASGNIVFGVGSYTYQSVTRDSFGFAFKATSGVVHGLRREIFKDPITDSGIKKSARGLLRVENEDGKLVLYDRQTEEQEKQGLLKVVFENGKLVQSTNLKEIRAKLEKELI